MAVENLSVTPSFSSQRNSLVESITQIKASPFGATLLELPTDLPSETLVNYLCTERDKVKLLRKSLLSGNWALKTLASSTIDTQITTLPDFEVFSIATIKPKSFTLGELFDLGDYRALNVGNTESTCPSCNTTSLFCPTTVAAIEHLPELFENCRIGIGTIVKADKFHTLKGLAWLNGVEADWGMADGDDQKNGFAIAPIDRFRYSLSNSERLREALSKFSDADPIGIYDIDSGLNYKLIRRSNSCPCCDSILSDIQTTDLVDYTINQLIEDTDKTKNSSLSQLLFRLGLGELTTDISLADLPITTRALVSLAVMATSSTSGSMILADSMLYFLQSEVQVSIELFDSIAKDLGIAIVFLEPCESKNTLPHPGAASLAEEREFFRVMLAKPNKCLLELFDLQDPLSEFFAKLPISLVQGIYPSIIRSFLMGTKTLNAGFSDIASENFKLSSMPSTTLAELPLLAAICKLNLEWANWVAGSPLAHHQLGTRLNQLTRFEKQLLRVMTSKRKKAGVAPCFSDWSLSHEELNRKIEVVDRFTQPLAE
jgi:hypothetical protein